VVVDWADPDDGTTPLHLAARKGDLEMVRENAGVQVCTAQVVRKCIFNEHSRVFLIFEQ
jgi:hypothetical protein